MISINELHKEYIDGESHVRALRGITLNIEKGEFLSIAGPSGSGKTTLLNLIGCIDTADSGSICIDGTDVSNRTIQELVTLRREKIGFVFQDFNLIPVLTAYENVSISLALLGMKEDDVRKKTLDILREVGLEGMEHRRPSKLSGGQQQRVAVARALVKQPLLVLADEPTANLDSRTGEEILRMMKEMNQTRGTTFIFSTHDTMVMDYADRLCRLHDGMIESDESRRPTG